MSAVVRYGLLVVGMIIGLGWDSISPKAAEPSIQAVATVGMVADIVQSVLGDEGQTTALLGSGTDPHSYKLNRQDIATLTTADVVFYNGLLLEGKMTDALIRLAGSGRPVLAVAATVDEDFLLAPPEFDGNYDPHLWMDVQGWIRATAVVEAQLRELYPERAEVFQVNASAYIAQLQALDDYAQRVVASIPDEQRILVTAHDAFGYFGRAYQLEVLGIQGISTESEAGLARIEALVDLLVERGIQAVFVETTVSDRNVQALIDGAAAQGHEVLIGGSLFSDAMGSPGTYEGTYLGMIDHNVTTITRALGGQAPIGGFQDRLTLPQE